MSFFGALQELLDSMMVEFGEIPLEIVTSSALNSKIAAATGLPPKFGFVEFVHGSHSVRFIVEEAK